MLFRSASVSGLTCSLMPGMAMDPSGLVSDASIRHSPITGSGTGPPHMPEWTDCFSARTSTLTTTMPRRAVVMDGSPVSKLLVSVRTMASAWSSLAFFLRNAPRCPDPTSSSPSTMILTFSGSPPPPLRQDSTAEVWTTMPALSSAAPRP